MRVGGADCAELGRTDDVATLGAGGRTPAHLVRRAKSLLRVAAGRRNDAMARELRTDRECMRGPVAHPLCAGRAGRHRARRAALHWNTRTLAPVVGLSPQSVPRVWQADGLQLHRVRPFQGRRAPHCLEQRPDVVGRYLHPPEPARGLCAEEKSQIQALDRTPPGLPRKRGRCGSMTPDSGRHGTTTLIATLELPTGQRSGPCLPKPRHPEWLRFLRLPDRQGLPDLALHLSGDNAARHRWLARHPRFHLHCLSTSSAWGLTLLARWFRELPSKRLPRGGFQSVADLPGPSPGRPRWRPAWPQGSGRARCCRRRHLHATADERAEAHHALLRGRWGRSVSAVTLY